ncbi:phage-related minor tail protein [Bradyrhizobium sp. GM6.1]
MAQADAAMAKSIPGVAGLSRSLLDGYGAGATFEAQIRKIGNAVDRGLGLDRAEVLIDAASRKFGLTADAIALAERGFVSIAPAIDAVNSKMAAAAENAQRLQGQLRAQSFQQGINAQFSIGGPDTSAARADDIRAYGNELDRLRARYNPLFAAGQGYKAELDEINRALQVGAISEVEHAAAIERTKAAFAGQVAGLRQVKSASQEATAAAGLQRYELINLSRQVQDVVVSLAGGQGLGTVALQQGSQIGDVFASSSATVGGFARQATTYLRGFLTSGTAVFGGIAVAVGGASLALEHFLTEQDKVKLALSGAGRGSGATVGGINAVAGAAASPFGLSVSSARELASALASTGKIANDNLLPIVQIGRDFATTFGVSDVEAAKSLAQAFADPVKGAEQLNERLGFLDAGMQRQIASLTAQNRIYDAQRVLLDGVKGSLATTSEVTSVWAQAWTAAKNAASGFYDYVGEKLANAGGLNASLEQQRDNLKKLVADYNNPFSPGSMGGGSDLEALKRQLSDINALIEKRAQATQNVAAAQASLRVSQTILAQLPEIGARQALQDAASIGGATAEDPILMKALGLTQQQVDRAKAILNQLRDDFRTTFQEIQAQSQISYDAVTAFSPSAKAAIAQRQAIEQYRSAGGLDPSEKAKIGQDAYTLSIHQTVTALQEAARSRALSASQGVQSSQLEIDLVGKSIGQQAEMRANLQAQQQLEQQASQYRTDFDQKQYDDLKKINAELGRRAELAAKTQINADIRFGAQTSLLSPEDAQIAQQLRFKYTDVQQALVSVEAQGLRTNAALSGLSSTISGQLVTGMTDIVDGTKSIGQGFGDMSKMVIRAIEEMIVKITIIQPLMQSLQLGANSLGLGSLFGSGYSGLTASGGIAGAVGPTSVGGLPLVPSALGNIFAGGHVIPFARGGIFGGPTIFPMANGGTGLAGEAGPEAIMPLRRGPDGKLGVSAGGGANDNRSPGGLVVNVINQTGVQAEASTSRRSNGEVTVTLKKLVDDTVGQSLSAGSGSRVLRNQYGVRQFMGQ